MRPKREANGTDPMSGNRLLAALPHSELQRLQDGLREVTLTRNQILYEPGVRIAHAWFPLDCTLAIAPPMADGCTPEAVTVGREGMAGNPWPGEAEERALDCCAVQVPGRAVILSTATMHRAAQESPALARLLTAHARAHAAAVGRALACRSCHPTEARLARVLLMALDREEEGSTSIRTTHEALATLLGVGRPTATLAARTLQQRGLIRLHRGRIEVPDRVGLEAASCECYRAIRTVFERLLPRTYR